MTPAIALLTRQNITHSVLSYTHNPDAKSFAEEVAEKLNVPIEEVFKTLVVECTFSTRSALCVAIVPANFQLSFKKFAKAVGAKKAEMASAQKVKASTGYVFGGVSPFGQKRLLSTVIHTSALKHDAIYVSAGKRGLELLISPKDLVSVLDAVEADIVN